VRAKHVALCCNAYIDELSPKLRAASCGGHYIVATSRSAGPRRSADAREHRLTDVNWVLDYSAARPTTGCCSAAVSYSARPLNTERHTRRMVKVFRNSPT